MTAFLGILMLDTRFPRPPGDIGNPVTFTRAGIPVRYAVVAGATPRRIVDEADASLVEPFLVAARGLVGEGARMIATSCGFLAAWQPVLARVLPVPVYTSSLLACRMLDEVGIVTIKAAALDRQVRAGVGLADGVPIEGVAPGCEFQRRILSNDAELDLAQAERDVVQAATALTRRAPWVRHIVLECTNMPPYRQAVAAATGRTVHDIETLLVAAYRRLDGATSSQPPLERIE